MDRLGRYHVPLKDLALWSMSIIILILVPCHANVCHDDNLHPQPLATTRLLCVVDLHRPSCIIGPLHLVARLLRHISTMALVDTNMRPVHIVPLLPDKDFPGSTTLGPLRETSKELIPRTKMLHEIGEKPLQVLLLGPQPLQPIPQQP